MLQHRVIRVFLSHPSGVDVAVAAVQRSVARLNAEWADFFNARVEIIAWENSFHPDASTDAQAAINRQLPDYEVYLGVMGARFGTPTPRAGSGTEEEFLAALARHRAAPKDVAIRFYFANLPLPVLDLDPDQLARVRAFRTRLGADGILYRDFSTAEQFAEMVGADLAALLRTFSPRVLREEAERERMAKIVRAQAQKATLGFKRIGEACGDMQRYFQEIVAYGDEIQAREAAIQALQPDERAEEEARLLEDVRGRIIAVATRVRALRVLMREDLGPGLAFFSAVATAVQQVGTPKEIEATRLLSAFLTKTTGQLRSLIRIFAAVAPRLDAEDDTPEELRAAFTLAAAEFRALGATLDLGLHVAQVVSSATAEALSAQAAG